MYCHAVKIALTPMQQLVNSVLQCLIIHADEEPKDIK
jgi:hypothetical protein